MWAQARRVQDVRGARGSGEVENGAAAHRSGGRTGYDHGGHATGGQGGVTTSTTNSRKAAAAPCHLLAARYGLGERAILWLDIVLTLA